MELKSLESDEESLNIELNKVQKKMKEISQESENIFKDNTKQLREKTSEVRILREDAGKFLLHHHLPHIRLSSSHRCCMSCE
jgi:hypothetical protein